MKTRYRNVTVDPDRHGKLRARFRKVGVKPVWMRTLPDQPGFEDELAAVRAGVPVERETAAPGSVEALFRRFYRSGDFAGKGSEATRKQRRGRLEPFRGEFGKDMVTDWNFEHIEAVLIRQTEKRRDEETGRMVGGQVAARNLRKELYRLFAYAKKLKWIGTNPVEEAEKIGKPRYGTGYHSWSEAEITQYQTRHKIGTRARLALEIILWTGQRRGDARLFGPQHVVRGKINYRASKNDADLWLPMAPDLRRAIDAMPSIGLRSFLITQYGKPFSAAGFGNKMREWCDLADLKHCTAHGLRKAIGRRMAQAKVTQIGIKAVGGWKGDEEVATYTAAVEQEEMAESALTATFARFGSGAEDAKNGQPCRTG